MGIASIKTQGVIAGATVFRFVEAPAMEFLACRGVHFAIR